MNAFAWQIEYTYGELQSLSGSYTNTDCGLSLSIISEHFNGKRSAQSEFLNLYVDLSIEGYGITEN